MKPVKRSSKTTNKNVQHGVKPKSFLYRKGRRYAVLFTEHVSHWCGRGPTRLVATIQRVNRAGLLIHTPIRVYAQLRK